MKTYEVVKDHKSGRIRVFVREERSPADPWSGARLRKHDLERRARIASLKAWWVALGYAWRDREQRLRLAGGGLFIAAFCAFPFLYLVLCLAAGILGEARPEPASLAVLSASVFVLMAGAVTLVGLRRFHR